MKRTATTISTFHLLACAALLFAAGCASDDGASGGSNGSAPGEGGKSWMTSSQPSRKAAAGESTLSTFSESTRAFMTEGLHQFSRQDPRWESTRAAWLALGPRESDFLVQTMWAGLLRSQALHAPDLVERARHELALIGAPSVPLMASVLIEGDIGEVEDPNTHQMVVLKVDDDQRLEASEVLTIIGAPAVPAVINAVERAETKSGKRYAVRTLGMMGDRGGAAGAREVASQSRSDDDVLRVEAVTGMRNFTDAITGAALVSALTDSDRLVREKAAESLAARGDVSAISSIRAAATRARAEGQRAEAQRLERAALKLERQSGR